MTTRVIFNTNTKLKAAAMKKARGQGLTYSAILNLATQAYVNDKLEVDVVGQAIEEGRRAVREGRIYSEKEARRKLGLGSVRRA